jgi:uncharacterized phage protein (TIGR02220 family)
LNDKQKSFVIYQNYESVFDMLSDFDAAALIRAIFKFARGAEVPELSQSANVAFLLISEQIKRDQEKYMKVCEKRKEAGKKGGRPRNQDAEEKTIGFSENQLENKKANGFSQNQTKANKAENDNENDNDNDNKIIKKHIVGKTNCMNCQTIINYLNEKTGAHYRATTPKTKKLIEARMKEGFTVEDFQTVIYKKTKQWKDNPDMCKFLRPETLFGTKFEGYLNEQEQAAESKESKFAFISERIRQNMETMAQTEDEDSADLI